MNRLPQVPVLLRIPPLPELFHRRAPRRKLHRLEQMDMAVEAHCHVPSGRGCCRPPTRRPAPPPHDIESLHPPNHNLDTPRRLPPTEHLLVPAPSLVPVENDQMTGFRRAAVHVARRLLEAVPDGAFKALVEHLAFHDEPADPVALRPQDEQVCATAAETVLAARCGRRR